MKASNGTGRALPKAVVVVERKATQTHVVQAIKAQASLFGGEG